MLSKLVGLDACHLTDTCAGDETRTRTAFLLPLSQSAGDQRPADPKSAAYAYSATPALYIKVDAHITIGDNDATYSASL